AGKAQAAQSAKSAAAKQGKDAKTLKDEDSRSSKELAVVYQRLSEQAEKATACIFDPKCLSSDRKVLLLMVQRREVLERLAARAQQGDLEAGYWRGTIAMEQARRQVNRGELNSDDLGARKEAMLMPVSCNHRQTKGCLMLVIASRRFLPMAMACLQISSALQNTTDVQALVF
ncbi:MAG: hypothetical protein EBU15_15125, partial [Betaproteobacteria bacterium]|nr:hypothetical protein [Betaproteobacteria bacterium]